MDIGLIVLGLLILACLPSYLRHRKKMELLDELVLYRAKAKHAYDGGDKQRWHFYSSLANEIKEEYEKKYGSL